MEVKIKKVEHVVLSLDANEAMCLKAILNSSYSITKKMPAEVEQFSEALWGELNDLEVMDLK